MGDVLKVPKEKLKELQVGTTVSRKTIVKKYKKTSKSFKRRHRRKKSKKAYFKALRRNRAGRVTDDLCASLEEFSVLDMEMAPLCDSNKLPEEIIEWQKQDQIAYWKSRAITLEIENRMLHQHLRNVYAQQIEYYEKNKDWKEIANKQSNEETQETTSEHRSSKSGKQNSSKTNNKQPSTSNNLNISETIKDMGKVLPKTPEGKNRLEEMKKIYGDKAQKIMGMETALQLNYERLVEEGSYNYWPNLPLKL